MFQHFYLGSYLVNVSVMHSTNFLLLSAVSMGPNKLAWILQFGSSGIGSGANGARGNSGARGANGVGYR